MSLELQSAIRQVGAPAAVVCVVSINGRKVYTFNADLSSTHFGAPWEAAATVVRHVQRHVVRAYKESRIDSVESLRVDCWANGRQLGGREARFYPGMREDDVLDLALCLGDWVGRRLAEPGIPFGQAEPLYKQRGLVFG